MQTSARRSISYPSADRSDRPDIPLHIKNLVDALELDASTSQGLAASRPANPGYARYFYWATDTKVLSYWDGSTWTNVGSTDLIAKSLIDAKGDLIVGLSNDTAGRLAVGSNGYQLVADNTQSAGVKWAMSALQDLISGKGDILAGTATDQVTNVVAGADGQMLIADSAQAAGVKWGSPVVPYMPTSFLTGDVSMGTQNQFYDGPSLSLVAGVWFVFAQVSTTRGTNEGQLCIRITDGSTVFSSTQRMTLGGGPTSVSSLQTFAIVTPGTTTTYKVVAACAETVTMKATGDFQGTTNKATSITAIRLA